MASAPNKGIWIPIGASTKELNAALAEAGIQLNIFKGKAEGAGKGLGNLEQGLKSVQREMRTGDRISQFYVNQLTSIVPVSAQAKDALNGVAGTMLEVGQNIGKALTPLALFMIAVQAIQTAVSIFNYMKESAKAAAEQIKLITKNYWDLKNATEAAARAKTGAPKKSDLQVELESLQTQKRIADEAERTASAQGATNREIQEAIELRQAYYALGGDDRLKIVQAKSDEETTRKDQANDRATTLINIESSQNSEIEKIRQRLALSLKELDRDDTISAKTKADRRVALEQQSARDIAAIRSQRVVKTFSRDLDISLLNNPSPIASARADYSKDVASLMASYGIDLSTKKGEAAYNSVATGSEDAFNWKSVIPDPEYRKQFLDDLEQLKELHEARQRELVALQSMRDNTSETDWVERQDTLDAIRQKKDRQAGDVFDSFNGPGTDSYAESFDKGNMPDLGDSRNQAASEAAKAKKKELSDLEKQMNSIGAATEPIAAGFGAIGAAIGGMAGSLVAQIANVAALTVKFIALAIAAAEASAAETPVVGWAMAVGAGAAVLGSIIGLIGGIGGKEFGGDVNRNTPYIVGEVGPELFVPTTAGTIIPNDQLAGAGAGGGQINITFNAPVDRSWWMSNQQNILDTLRDASRNRRT